MIALSPEVKPVESTIDTSNLQETTNDELKQLADGVVSNPENQKQVRFFPDQWNSLTHEQKVNIAWQLTTEIQNSIHELSDLWIEYKPETSEITKEDIDNLNALEFVCANRKILPNPTWEEFERVLEETAKDMWKEVNDKWLLNTIPNSFDKNINKSDK